MSEQPILITQLNDFIFCPVSIYFHSLEEDTDKILYQDSVQLNGSAAHKKSDLAEYSTKKNILQGISVYSEKYNLVGKIDVFDADKGIITERKKKIRQIFDGYIFQIYAQYYALTEMGYKINELHLYSMDDNRVYKIEMPENDKDMSKKFENTITAINEFVFDDFVQTNPLKCKNCIYNVLCSFSAEEEM